MAVIKTIAVGITARTGKFHSAMQRVQKRMRKVSRTFKNTVTSLAGIGSFAAAGAGFAFLTKSSLGAVDALAKTADKLGLTTEALAGLQHAAELSGVSANTFNMGLQRMTRRVAEAAQGTGEAKAAIAELGLSAQKLAAMSPDKQFAAIADAMEQVASQSDRVRLGFKLFDSEGVALINTLRGGSAALMQAQKDAEMLGLTLSRETAAQVEQANDAFTRMKAGFRGLAITVAAKLAPSLEALANKLTGVINWVRSLSSETVQSVINTAKWVAGIGAAILIAPRIISMIRSIVKAFQALAKSQVVIKALSGPAGLASLAIGATAATAAIAATSSAFGRFNSELEEAGKNAQMVARSVDDTTTALTEFKEVAAPEKTFRFGGLAGVTEADFDRWRSKAVQVAEAVKTPFEKFNDTMAELKRLFDLNLLSVQNYERAVDAATKKLKDLTGEQKEIKTPTTDPGESSARVIDFRNISVAGLNIGLKKKAQNVTDKEGNRLLSQIADNTENQVATAG